MEDGVEEGSVVYDLVAKPPNCMKPSSRCAWPGQSLWRLLIPQPAICVCGGHLH
jgi:hypothetical protein